MSNRAAEIDFYQVLGVSNTADAAQIKEAYRRLVRLHHPDANPTSREASEARMKLIVEAYATLGDPQRRERFDLEHQIRQITAREIEPEISGARSLITRVRMALELSSPEFAGRLGLSDATLQSMEARDAIPQSPVQLRTFINLCEQAAQKLEDRGQLGGRSRYSHRAQTQTHATRRNELIDERKRQRNGFAAVFFRRRIVALLISNSRRLRSITSSLPPPRGGNCLRFSSTRSFR
jgi:curved DNA-binding protein CbpA